MNTEITQGVTFLARYLERKQIDTDQVEQFKQKLQQILERRYAGHFYKSEPLRGSAYRSIIIAHGQLDPVLLQAYQAHSGINDMAAAFPNDFILWIDPGSVAYRSGGERGITYTIWQDKQSSDFFSKASSNGIVIRSPSKEPSPNLQAQGPGESLSPPGVAALLNGQNSWIDSQDTW
jgi:hypothetical protein